MPGTLAAHDDLACSPIYIVDLRGDHFRRPQAPRRASSSTMA